MKKTVYQCDRCSEKIDFPREKMITVSYNEQNADSPDILHRRMEFCILCFKEFEKFMKKFMKMDRSNIL